mgnify:CR=1 FL=1
MGRAGGWEGRQAGGPNLGLQRRGRGAARARTASYILNKCEVASEPVAWMMQNGHEHRRGHACCYRTSSCVFMA